VRQRTQLFWKPLFALFAVCAVTSGVAWSTLLTSFCASNPRTPAPETQHVIAFNCHGMTVFISPFENALRHWLIPVSGFFTFLSVLAAAMVVLAAAKVRIDVQVHFSDTSSRSPHCKGDRD
jgi:hypothetical protein